MAIETARDLLDLPAGSIVLARQMYAIVKDSKVPGSRSWLGPEFSIGNTPQQGINWIGTPPSVRAVIIKATAGAYAEDGWIDAAATRYRYSYKARKTTINRLDTSNRVLDRQPEFRYPILLFIREKTGFRLSGYFEVAELEERSVVLCRSTSGRDSEFPDYDPIFLEGNRRYVTHLIAERNRTVIDMAKKDRPWICEVCGQAFHNIYGVAYIEAHHKTPVERFDAEHPVRPSDLALLCPNCHKAIHLYMQSGESNFEKLATTLQGIIRARASAAHASTASEADKSAS